jgi:hypothetical protein
VRSSPPIKPTPSANSAFAGLRRRFRSFACVAEQHWAVLMPVVIIVHHAPLRACRSLALGLSAHDTEAMIARVWRGELFESRAVKSIMSCTAVWSPYRVMSTFQLSLHGHNGAVVTRTTRQAAESAASRDLRIPQVDKTRNPKLIKDYALAGISRTFTRRQDTKVTPSMWPH